MRLLINRQKTFFLCIVVTVVILITLNVGWLPDSEIGLEDFQPPSASSKWAKDSPHCMLEIDCKRYYQECSTEEKKSYIKDAYRFAWKNYHRYAWGHDHLKPLSRRYDDDLLGLGATLIDSLTGLLLMDLKEEYRLSLEWLEDFSMANSKRSEASLFEVCIRILGSLVSSYFITKDKILLEKAKEVGDVAMRCYGKGKSHNIPYITLQFWDMNGGIRCFDHDERDCLHYTCDSIAKNCSYSYCQVEVAPVGTLGLELRALSYATGDDQYWKAVNRTGNQLLKYTTWHGLVSRRLYRDENRFVSSSDVSTGPGVDSYYEYLLKQWAQSHFKATRYKQAYLEAVDGIRDELMVKVRTRGKEVNVLGHRLYNVTVTTELHHLSCFLPATLALGHYYGMPYDHLTLAEDIMRTCYFLYESQPTGLSPEQAIFRFDGLSVSQTENNLRPETIESLFVMYRVTGNPIYREWGWNIFQAFERVSRTCFGYSAVQDVTDVHTALTDKMESFYLAETLKYFYLLFEDDKSVYSLDDIVLNTEAHPLPIMRDYKGHY